MIRKGYELHRETVDGVERRLFLFRPEGGGSQLGIYRLTPDGWVAEEDPQVWVRMLGSAMLRLVEPSTERAAEGPKAPDGSTDEASRETTPPESSPRPQAGQGEVDGD